MSLDPSNGSQRADRIDAYLRLALAAPDMVLLRRYFSERADAEAASEPLTDAERHWVTTNLGNNPPWHEAWQELEADYGKSVAWTPALMPTASKTTEAQEPSRRVVRWLVAAAIAVFVLYGMLWAVGRLALPATHTLASVSAYQDVLRETTRGNSTGARSRFAQGGEALLAAHRSTFGVFPHYDDAYVQEALTHLHRAFERTHDPFQQAEITFFLAKAYLMQGDVATARFWLEQTLAQNVADYREDATTLLRHLNEHYRPTRIKGAQ
jgi:tetratricopeptide (TPR) repeat protein